MSMATETTETLGANIKFLREKKGWTQNELAEKCGVSRPRIAEIESGKFNPSVETVENIANNLGVHISRLFRNPAA
jgi:transcriptional regulator with XRE-family HTH domain